MLNTHVRICFQFYYARSHRAVALPVSHRVMMACGICVGVRVFVPFVCFIIWKTRCVSTKLYECVIRLPALRARTLRSNTTLEHYVQKHSSEIRYPNSSDLVDLMPSNRKPTTQRFRGQRFRANHTEMRTCFEYSREPILWFRFRLFYPKRNRRSIVIRSR